MLNTLNTKTGRRGREEKGKGKGKGAGCGEVGGGGGRGNQDRFIPYYARHLFSHVVSETRPTAASALALK